jgi:hypothetical protein
LRTIATQMCSNCTREGPNSDLSVPSSVATSGWELQVGRASWRYVTGEFAHIVQYRVVGLDANHNSVNLSHAGGYRSADARAEAGSRGDHRNLSRRGGVSHRCGRFAWQDVLLGPSR